jgi:hypothetical protein
MDAQAEVNYWPKRDLEARLRRSGFIVHSHAMIDLLPYPHQLYVCRKPAYLSGGASSTLPAEPEPSIK